MKQCAKSKTEPGDGLDNDCDGNIDEEILNEKDDDGDGKLDEDLQLVRRAKYSVLIVYDYRLVKGLVNLKLQGLQHHKIIVTKGRINDPTNKPTDQPTKYS